MRSVSRVVFVLGLFSAFLGLLTRWGGTWADGWKAAAGCVAVSLLWMAAAFIPRSSPWSHWTTRLLFAGTTAAAIALVAAGKPYRWLGAATLTLLGSLLWGSYQRTAHYLGREDTGPMRLFAWFVFFKDPDGLDVKRRAERSGPEAERGEKVI
jgi:hypothetical protein